MYDMFESRDAPTFLRCGHAMHSSCFKKFAKKSINCPLCQKGIIKNDDYNAYVQNEIDKVKMPEELQRKVMILCNECNEKCENDFHFFGVKCLSCGSFNTKLI
mmetsp:Transcript_32/g.26  ORF Transcript_32/g.26 Transcript_32/m.26 type:complete len:103 (-) Transcript_32:41-349(-)